MENKVSLKEDTLDESSSLLPRYCDKGFGKDSFQQPNDSEVHQCVTLDGDGRLSSKITRPSIKKVNRVRSILLNWAFQLGILTVVILLSISYVKKEVNDLNALMQSEQNEMNDLREQIKTDRELIDHLLNVVKEHEVVIERFNSSVSNQDILEELDRIETNVSRTQMSLENSLRETTQTIQDQLLLTEQQLQIAVNDAEKVIQEQVVQVKKDVEQYVIRTEAQFSMENSFMVYQLAGTFTVLSCLISMWHMTSHIRKLNQPDVQRKILAILWMSPVYAITSWFSLVFPKAEGWLAIIKDGYEGYIIYTFLSFCIAVIGKGDRATVVNLLAEHAHHLSPPFRLFGCFELCGLCKPERFEDSRALADAILLQCQTYAMQFVFLRPLTTMAMVVLQKYNYHGPQDTTVANVNYLSPQVYITLIQNVSIFVAFTGLLKFYHAVDQELAWCRPFAKFLCIKGVVFMTFWQGLAITILAKTTDVVALKSNDDVEIKTDEWAKSAQNFLICLEMLLFSIAHFYCFPVDEWVEGYRVKNSRTKISDTVALGDFVADLKLLLTSKATNGSKKLSRKKLISKPETIPETEDEQSLSETDTTSIMNSSFDEEENSSAFTPKSDLSSRSLYQGQRQINFENKTNISSKEQEYIAAALEMSLGSINEDPEIAEAKERLLASQILSPEFFDFDKLDDDVPKNDNTTNFLKEEHIDSLNSVDMNEHIICASCPSKQSCSTGNCMGQFTSSDHTSTVRTPAKSNVMDSIHSDLAAVSSLLISIPSPPPTEPPPPPPLDEDHELNDSVRLSHMDDIGNNLTGLTPVVLAREPNRAQGLETKATVRSEADNKEIGNRKNGYCAVDTATINLDDGTHFIEVINPSLLKTAATVVLTEEITYDKNEAT